MICFTCIFISVMNYIFTDKLKNNRSKWLFIVILLVSFFTFSGIVLKPQVAFNVQRTTLIANPQKGFVKSISYKRAALGVYNCCSTRPFFTKSTFDISRMHNRQVCTCINRLEISYKCRPQTALFFPAKIFPQNVGDYPSTSLG